MEEWKEKKEAEEEEEEVTHQSDGDNLESIHRS